MVCHDMHWTLAQAKSQPTDFMDKLFTIIHMKIIAERDKNNG